MALTSASHESGAYPIFHDLIVASVNFLSSSKYFLALSAKAEFHKTADQNDTAISMVLSTRSRSVLTAGGSALTMTPALPANNRRASGKSIPSCFMINAKISPPSPQPKQCQICLGFDTMNDGVFSS